jgi:hypothetical protein
LLVAFVLGLSLQKPISIALKGYPSPRQSNTPLTPCDVTTNKEPEEASPSQRQLNLAPRRIDGAVQTTPVVRMVNSSTCASLRLAGFQVSITAGLGVHRGIREANRLGAFSGNQIY